MNNRDNLLFSDFNPTSREEWIEKVNIDLKGADFDRKLVWKNLSKIAIQPYYNAEDKQAYLKNTGENALTLVNYRSIITKSEIDANKLAIKAVEEGINGLLFEIEGTVSAAKLLEGIDLNAVSVSFILRNNEIGFAADFFAFVEGQAIAPENVKGYFDLELISTYITKGTLEGNQFSTAAKLVKLAEAYPNFKALTISGGEYLDSGANQVQEVAYTLNSLVYIIEKITNEEVTVESIFNSLNFQLAIGSEYFVEIGKFRAFNNLLHEVASKYGVTDFSFTLNAKTSIWSKSITDAHTNLLRATTEVMSAILGNVNGVLIDAYDKEFKEESGFSSRIAGNIATILKEESYLGKVANPVDGAYYIEEVSTKIAAQALALFKDIEENGGFYQAFENQVIQNQIAEIRLQKIKLISQRRLAMVGVNKYPNLMEKVAADLLSDAEPHADPKLLKPRRASLEIEAIRKTTETLVDKTGVRPVIELVSFGNLTMRKARAAFAYDFLGVSGYNILQEQSYEGAEQAAEASAKSKTHVVVICSSDQDYEASAISFVKSFRSLNADKVLLLAGNPINIIDQLTAAGLDGCIHMKSDIINTISSVQHKIQKSIKSLEV